MQINILIELKSVMVVCHREKEPWICVWNHTNGSQKAATNIVHQKMLSMMLIAMEYDVFENGRGCSQFFANPFSTLLWSTIFNAKESLSSSNWKLQVIRMLAKATGQSATLKIKNFGGLQVACGYCLSLLFVVVASTVELSKSLLLERLHGRHTDSGFRVSVTTLSSPWSRMRIATQNRNDRFYSLETWRRINSSLIFNLPPIHSIRNRHPTRSLRIFGIFILAVL